ncbi:MAG: ribosome alternative rescue factor ArfA [Alteromonadaceae bacterium]|nr:ribosome alternative rescue factor ArfA [Alteromonadaceae bacterium]
MSKSKRKLNSINEKNNITPVETGRGIVKDNFLAALVTSRVYKMQIVKAKKGKGAYQRKDKHKGRESYLMAA